MLAPAEGATNAQVAADPGVSRDLVETWKPSTDPLFVDKVRDVAGVHLDPPEMAMEKEPQAVHLNQDR